MKKQFSIGAVILIVVLCCILTFVSTLSISTVMQNAGSNSTASESDTSGTASGTIDQELYNKLLELDKIVNSNFVGEIDKQYLQDYIMRGYVAGLNDKYSMYLSVQDMNDRMASLNSELIGIGVNVIFDDTLNGIYITNVMLDSPALEAGLLPGDLITAVEDIQVTASTYNSAVLAVKGNEGEIRKITIKRAPDYTLTETLEITIRKVIQTTVIYELLEDNVAYIQITNFNTPTPDEFIKALESAENDGAESYIFDLRNNPGGELDSICDILDLLLPEGPIIRIVDADGTDFVYRNSDAAELDAPMVVLINNNTASAAELFTAALRDYDKATLVGTNTYGKGTMQRIITLPDGSGISLSTNLYNPPFGDNYEGIGITPNIEVTLTEEQQKNFYKLTYDEDPQIQAALSKLKNVNTGD